MTIATGPANGPAIQMMRAGEAHPMRPWPRYLLTPEAWRAMAQALRSDPTPEFLGLWADTAHVHALFMADAPLLASVRVEAGLFDALSPARPAAAGFERMVHDLWGHFAGGGVDPRPLLDQGRWPVLRPLSARPVPNAAPPDPPEFLGAAGHDLHQMPIGPIGGIMDPVHLRITAAGETIARLEAGLGYAHRGIPALMRGKTLLAAAPLAARITSDSTVAHSVAFARALEAAADINPPPRGHALRGIMMELERIATQLGDLGATPGFLGARCSDLREGVLRANHAAFGHRLLMDRVVPGGTSVDLTPAAASAIPTVLDRVASALPGLLRGLRLVKAMPRAGAGRLSLQLADIGECVRLLRIGLADLPPGAVNVAIPSESGEGLGVANGPRGDIWHWLQLDSGVVAANFARDPAWLQWPLAEAACSGASLSGVPSILRSFIPVSSGLEL